LEALQFQFDNPTEHAQIGEQLLCRHELFPNVSTIIRFHHQGWENGANDTIVKGKSPMASHVVHLADRTAVLMNKEQEILEQAEKITGQIKIKSGKLFVPEIVSSFINVARKECFWLDTIALANGETPLNAVVAPLGEIDMNGLTCLSELFARIIDSRSRYTAMHTSGITVTAESLARVAGFSVTEQQNMKIAGNLHDLGKLSLPSELLDKPAALSKEESSIVKQHPYHTFRALERFDNLHIINQWASFHHERTDGTGYPFRLSSKELSPGCRIMSIADVFAGMTEDRPWRKGMTAEESLTIIEQMANKSNLDSEIVKMLKANFKEINSLRIAAQRASIDRHRQLQNE
jgi:HD-GYP domain-containing protein (c-di-GMP phosphodiesterase class II)